LCLGILCGYISSCCKVEVKCGDVCFFFKLIHKVSMFDYMMFFLMDCMDYECLSNVVWFFIFFRIIDGAWFLWFYFFMSHIRFWKLLLSIHKSKQYL
jgi:hypothetical protein